MIDWGSSYTSRWGLYRVNRYTWAEEEMIPGIDSFSFSTDGTDDVPKLNTGSVTRTGKIDEPLRPGLYRIIMTASQNGESQRVPVCTLYLQAASEQVSKRVSSQTLNGYSVLQPADDFKMKQVEYIAKDANGPQWVLNRLRDCLECPVYQVGEGFKMKDYLVFGIDTSILTAAWNILDSGGWVMQSNGNGEITIMEKPKEPKLVIGKSRAAMVQEDISIDYDYSSIPNRYTVISGEESVTVENRKESGHVGYGALGWWRDVVEENPTLTDYESPMSYANRQMEESSTLFKRYSYTRKYWPGLGEFDIIRMELNERGLQGDFRILSQTVNGGNGITVNEVGAVELNEYRRYDANQ